jgi:GTPase SAR1 family protein
MQHSKGFGNIALIGDAGSGKTVLCSNILGDQVGKVASTECAGGATSEITPSKVEKG